MLQPLPGNIDKCGWPYAVCLARMLIYFIYAISFSWPGLTYAYSPSTECPPIQSITVAAGGTSNTDLSSCSVFGLDGMPVLPSHGSVPNVNPTTGNGTSLVTYINNGDGALVDTFTVLDDLNGTIVFNVTVLPLASSITLSPSTLPTPVIGTAYNQSVTASGGTAPYTFAITTGALPAGLTLSSSGTLSGTPTAGGTFNFTVSATDQATTSGSRAYTMTISAPTISLTPTTLPAAAVASAYNQTVTASGGTASYAYMISAGALPAGLSLSNTGVVSGTPTAGGTFNFTVRATDSSTGTGPYAGTRAYSLTVNAPTITLTPVSMPVMTVATGFSQNVIASGGTASYTYSVSAGALPTGLTLASNGTLSGTPSTSGPYNFTITATDSSIGTGPYTGSRAYSVTVAAGVPVAGAVSATVAYNSIANTITLNLSGGTATSVVVVTAATHGNAVAGGTSISYTPVTGYAGSDTFTYTASNGSGTSSPATVTLTISTPTLTITPSASWSVVDGVSYNQVLTWSGGAAPYTGITIGGLPPGLSVSATDSNSATISGVPTSVGSFTVTASAIDSSTGSGPFTKSQSFTFTVNPPSIGLTPSGPALSTSYGSAFSQIFSASGGVAPYTYTLTGSLPAGLSWNAGSATLSGTATQSGSFPISISATDHSTGTGAPFSTSISYTLMVIAPTINVTPSSLPSASVAQAYSASVSANGGIAPYHYSVIAGTLPLGVTLNPTSGTLSGTPTAAGTFSFTIQASDANAYTGSQAYSMTISAPTLTLSPSSIPSAAVATVYSATFSASGGTAPYSFALIAGSLPTGISLNSSTGLLSGSTVQSGSFPITVRVTDSSTGSSAPFTTQNSYILTVAAPTIALTPSSIPSGTVATNYATSISASGGAAPYTYSVSAGALPAGITLNTITGALSGIPTTAGTFNFTLKALDSHGFNGTQAYSLQLAAASLNLNPSHLPDAVAEAVYSTTLTASGGTVPYSFTLTSGTLPSGLTLNTSSGVLAGTANVNGSFPITITVTDSSSGVGAPFHTSHSYILNVGAPTITLTPNTLSGAKVNVAYSQQMHAAGGTAPYTYSVSSGSLPTGLILNSSTGVLNGTPTAAGAFNFTLQVADAHNFIAQQALSLTVAQAQPIAADDSANTAANQSLTVNVSANDAGTITSIAIHTPPSHGSVVVSDLNVIYTPASNFFGNDTLRYIAIGPGGSSLPATLTLTVTPLALPVAVAQTVTVLAGKTVTIHAATDASGGPFTVAAVVTAPSSGTTTINGTDIVYTAAANASGQIKFDYTLANAFGVSTPVSATVNINPLPVTGSHTMRATTAGTSTIDLLSGASGGPFTAANLIGVSPATAGTAVIRDVGTVAQPSYQMTFTVVPTFVGVATIGYTLSNAYATSAPGMIEITIAPRRDMSTDPEVTGLLSAQANSARRFATAQLSNFTRRLEGLHDDGWSSSGFGLSLVPTGKRPSVAGATWLGTDDQQPDARLQAHMRKVSWPQQVLSDPTLKLADNHKIGTDLPELPRQRDNDKQALAFWIGGALDFGQQYINGRQSGFKFSTSGISIGSDYRMNDIATLGVGAGFSRDHSDIGNNGSKSSADSTVVALYGSLRPGKHVFIDGVLGYGRLHFDTTRYITDDGGFATGLRYGNEVFGAIVAGMEYRGATWLISPYGRLELVSATLGEYTETNADVNALTYFKQNVHSNNGALGLRTEARYVLGIGTLMPRFRMEYRHQFEGADQAALAYANTAAAGPAYIAHTNNQFIGNWNAGLGSRLLLRNGVTLVIDYNDNISTGNGHNQSIIVNAVIPFY